MSGSSASWSSPDRHHQPPTPAPVPVPGLTTPTTPYYHYTQSQAAGSPPPIASYDPNSVLDLSIDPGNYIAYPAVFYSQDQYSAQQRLPAQSQQQRQSAQDVQRGQRPPQPSFRGPPSTTNLVVLTQRQAAQQLQLEQQQQYQQQQSSPSTPGMYTSSSASSPSPSVAAFEGNILFWTSESLPYVFIYNPFPFPSCLVSPLLSSSSCPIAYAR